jgi:ribosomal protein S27AE
MKLLASDRKCVEITVNDGAVIRRGKDATFTVPDDMGKSIAKSSEFAIVGTNFQGVKSFRCQGCGFLAVFRDHCGRCGGTDLKEE